MRRLRPVPLVLAIICFCLPWIEIRCNDPNRGLIVTSQSGFQMTRGEVTTTVKGQLVSTGERDKQAQGAGNRLRPVPLMIVHIAALVAALVVGVVVRERAMRLALATLACGVAAGALMVQVAMGFPLVEGVTRGEDGWSYTGWFWLALACSMAAPVASIAEMLGPVKSPAGLTGTDPPDHDPLPPAKTPHDPFA